LSTTFSTSGFDVLSFCLSFSISPSKSSSSVLNESSEASLASAPLNSYSAIDFSPPVCSDSSFVISSIAMVGLAALSPKFPPSPKRLAGATAKVVLLYKAFIG